MSKKVLVTGASGFIGVEAVAVLQRAGYHVIAASRYPTRVQSRGVEAVQLPEGDLTEDFQFRRLVDQVDHIVHLAGIAHTELPAHQAALLYQQANVSLTVQLCSIATGSIGGKFIYLSSIRAQSGRCSSRTIDETQLERPTNEYGRSKLAAERMVAEFFPQGNFTILRPVLVYGHGVKGNLKMLETLANLPVPLPFGSLTGRRSLLSRASLCTAILHSLGEKATDGETFIVADRQAVTVAEIVSALRISAGRRPSIFNVSPRFLHLGALLTRQNAHWEALAHSLVAHSGKLQSTGWSAVVDTSAELTACFRSRSEVS